MADETKEDVAAMNDIRIVTGPVIGLTTTNSSIVLVEVDKDADISVLLSNKSKKIKNVRVTKTLKANVPQAFRVKGLIPNKLYKVEVQATDEEKRIVNYKERVGQVKTPAKMEDLLNHIGIVSCNKIDYTNTNNSKKRRHRRSDMWKKLLKDHESSKFTMLLHVGDQVHADADAVGDGEVVRVGNNAYLKSRAKIQETMGSTFIRGQIPAAKRKKLRPEIVELYRDMYRQTWNYGPTAQLLRSVPSIMQFDDHEFRDSLGLNDEDKKKDSMEHFIITCARQAYYEYQRQLWDHTVMSKLNVQGALTTSADDTGDSVSTEFHSHLFGKAGIMFLDTRSAQSWLHSADMDEDESKLGAAQWSKIKKCLANKKIQTWIFVSPTPIVLLGDVQKGSEKYLYDDVDGMWDSTKHQGERESLLKTIFNWRETFAEDAKKRPLKRYAVIVSGDAHMGAFTHIRRHAGDRSSPIMQLTASPVANDTLADLIKQEILKRKNPLYKRAKKHVDKHVQKGKKVAKDATGKAVKKGKHMVKKGKDAVEDAVEDAVGKVKSKLRATGGAGGEAVDAAEEMVEALEGTASAASKRVSKAAKSDAAKAMKNAVDAAEETKDAVVDKAEELVDAALDLVLQEAKEVSNTLMHELVEFVINSAVGGRGPIPGAEGMTFQHSRLYIEPLYGVLKMPHNKGGSAYLRNAKGLIDFKSAGLKLPLTERCFPCLY